jgi:LuxR family maltose regulon positive regulatory protein
VSPHAELDPLEATKFHPPRTPPGWVTRGRLTDELEAGIEHPLTLLAAGAGAGKSAVVSSWMAQRTDEVAVGWLSLDRGDSDRRRFWRAVLEALKRGGAPEPVASLSSHPSETVEQVIAALINALADLSEPVVLVLDDFHELGSGSAVADVDRLLRRPPDALRLVIATRSDPQLRLARLRMAGQLRELRDRDLAFTETEAAQLLAASGVRLSSQAATRLWRRTEGWTAGLRLATLTLRTHDEPEAFVDHFAGDDATVSGFLLAEVLAQQPPELRDFLLKTSVADVLSRELADAITGRRDGEQSLARLEREHALVSALGPDRRWFRYHPLFAELLRSQLRFEMPDLVGGLHRRAAIWHADSSRAAQALWHAAAASDWDLVGALAGEHWVPLLIRGELGALGAALAQLPRGPATRDPEVALAFSGVQLDAGDEAGSALFDRATEARDRVPEPRRERFDLAAAIVGLMRSRLRGDIAGARTAARALLAPELAAERASVGEHELKALALTNLGVAELWTGDGEAAARDLKAGRRAAELAGRDWLVLLCTVHLAAQAVIDGRIAAATRLAEQAGILADQNGWSRSWPAGLAAGVQSAVAFERGRLDEAELLLDRADELLASTRETPVRVAVHLQRARLHLAAGRPEPALESLELADELLEEFPLAPSLNGLALGLEATVTAALGRHDDAEAMLGRSSATAEQAAALARLRLLAGDAPGARTAVAAFLDDAVGAFGSTRISVWVLDALAADVEADHERASASLEQALDRAESNGYHRPFTELGAPMLPLLHRQLRRGTAHRSLIDDLLHELEQPRENGCPRALLVERLSDREAVVLRFLPTMMSNHEIASELFVSVNTVKTHLKSIYRKLDVMDRRDAVRRGRELELLGP